MDLLPYHTLLDALEVAAVWDEPFVTMWRAENDTDTVTFGEFRHWSCAQAAMLQQKGVRAGDTVVLILPQGIPLMTAFAGAMMLGAVPAILAYPNFKVEPAKYRSGLAGVTANLHARAVVLDDAFPPELLEHVRTGEGAELLHAVDGPSSPPPEMPRVFVAPESVAFIQHSAGTTGLQKGVALSHAAVLRQLGHLIRALKVDRANDRVYSWLPLYHDMGLIACFLLPMVAHLHVVMQSPAEWVMQPETMLQVISDHRCTIAWVPNFTFQFLARRVQAEERRRLDLSHLRLLINCAEPVRAQSIDEFLTAFADTGLRRGAVQSSYAMAENVFAVTQSGINIDDAAGPRRLWIDAAAFRDHRVVPVAAPVAPPAEPNAAPSQDAMCLVSSGPCLPGNRARIVDALGHPLPDGRVGEILIQSDSLFEGYYNRPDLTAEVMRDGEYLSGDLGFLWEGELFVIGRKKDLIIVAGRNFYPQDIEEIISSHPAVHDGRAIALGIYNPELGTEDIVVAAEVTGDGPPENALAVERELKNAVTGELGVAMRAVYLKPSGWIVKSTAGKPARSATLEKLLREHPELSSAELAAAPGASLSENLSANLSEAQMNEMAEYLATSFLRRSSGQIDKNTALVSSGLVDSFALVDVLLKLEEITGTRIPAGKVQAKDMDTIELMFATARRVGKPRSQYSVLSNQ